MFKQLKTKKLEREIHFFPIHRTTASYENTAEKSKFVNNQPEQLRVTKPISKFINPSLDKLTTSIVTRILLGQGVFEFSIMPFDVPQKCRFLSSLL